MEMDENIRGAAIMSNAFIAKTSLRCMHGMQVLKLKIWFGLTVEDVIITMRGQLAILWARGGDQAMKST